MEEEQFIGFVKSLISMQYNYIIQHTHEKFILICDANPFQVQEAIYNWLNEPERKELFLTQLYCDCWENEITKDGTRPVSSTCPIHGPISLLKD